MSGLPIDIVDTGAGRSTAWRRRQPARAAELSVGEPRFEQSPAGYYFNPFAFARPVVLAGQPIPSSNGAAMAAAAGTDIGNVGRNVLRGPRQTNVDFSVIKRFSVDGAKNIEFRAEFFNLFNHVNFANPISDFNAILASGGSIDPLTGK